ncbi:MAG: RNA-directed DNA polymerase [Nitrososphaera sp.]|nr:RNA-directed DNA polymerase [Nitrososphaera sp.]
MKEDLLRKGYFPENLPPAFSSRGIADYCDANPAPEFLSQVDRPVRAAVYSASKRGMTRRTFSVVHPVTGHDLAAFISTRWDEMAEFFRQSSYSLSVPRHTPDGDRALVICSHNELEKIRLSRLSQYRFIAKTDISRFYHSIYTHSIPWAFHEKHAAKADRSPDSPKIFFNRADQILRFGQDGQTIGIPVGPDTSRVFAEIIGTAIDLEFRKRYGDVECAVLRHVDDVWIGTHSHADAERALWRYREAIRGFELDINENKTHIYSENFRFSDGWPIEIQRQLEFAINTTDRRAPERLRAALEHAFSLAVAGGDDGVLKFVVRYLDQSDFKWKHWETVEPFLKRAAVHFGHTIDYIARVIVWRHLAREDLDNKAWSAILVTILDRHGRLGNDSEVCWGIYACMRLGIQIDREVAKNILENCGALSVLALLNCVELKLVVAEIFERAQEVLSLERATGPYWPVIMEWKTRQWPYHDQLTVEHDLIERMSAAGVVMFDSKELPPVFTDVDVVDFGSVSEAIEHRVSIYEDDGEAERE